MTDITKTPALLLIPATSQFIDRKEYITDCLKVVKELGYLPLLYDLIEKYQVWEQSDFICESINAVEVVFVFTDFEDGKNLCDLVQRMNPERVITEVKLPGGLLKYENEVAKILSEVSSKSGIPVEDLKRKTRKREIVDMRYVYYRRAKEMTKASLYKIGDLVGKDHASVIHGIKEATTTRQVILKYETIFNET